MALKPAIPTREIAASLPPASMTSARPRRIASIPSPIAIVEAAQAVHWDESGPFVPSSIETRAAPMFGMMAVIEKGLTRPGSALDERFADALERLEAAHRGRDGDADPFALLLDLQPSVYPCLMRRGNDHLREPVHTPRLLALDPLRRLEALGLAGERDREAGGVERRDRAGRPYTCDELLPTRPHVVTQRRHRAQPGDHDSPTAASGH